MLFTSAKITHLNSLPQGQPQRDERTLSMVAAMKNELFVSCTNHGECEAVCPKQIPLEFIGKMNRDLIRALWHRHREPLVIPGVVQLPYAEDSHQHFHGVRTERNNAALHKAEIAVPSHKAAEIE
jgi:succinate dehydrogenase / fumarate reductase iron-sulfur subunit